MRHQHCLSTRLRSTGHGHVDAGAGRPTGTQIPLHPLLEGRTLLARVVAEYRILSRWRRRTMVQNNVILRHKIIHFPTSLEVSEVSE